MQINNTAELAAAEERLRELRQKSRDLMIDPRSATPEGYDIVSAEQRSLRVDILELKDSIELYRNPIIRRLKNEKVVDISLHDNGKVYAETDESWWGICELTKDDLLALSGELERIAGTMK